MTLMCLLISANIKAIKLYEKNGYILQNNETFEDNNRFFVQQQPGTSDGY